MELIFKVQLLHLEFSHQGLVFYLVFTQKT